MKQQVLYSVLMLSMLALAYYLLLQASVVLKDAYIAGSLWA